MLLVVVSMRNLGDLTRIREDMQIQLIMQIQKHRVEPTPQHSAECSVVVEVGLTAAFRIKLVNIMFKTYWCVSAC